MTNNPFLNGLAGSAYVLLVASFVFFGSSLGVVPENIHPVAAITGFLSLFVFSAATMGYLILSVPLRMFLEGEKTGAIAFFSKTLLAFAAVSVIAFFALSLIPNPVPAV